VMDCDMVLMVYHFRKMQTETVNFFQLTQQNNKRNNRVCSAKTPMEKWRPSSAESCGAEIHMAKTRSRSPATDPLSFHFPIPLSLRLQCSTVQQKNIPTHSHPAPAGCELLQLQKSRVNLSSKPNRPDHQTEPIARPLLHTILQASTTQPPTRTEDRESGGPTPSPQHHQPTEPTNMGSTSPTAHGSISSETPASVNRASSSSSGHRCFVCNRTYERADHLNRHLKSRKQALPDVDCIFWIGTYVDSGVDDNERAYKCPECGKGFNRA
jgi:hypothetical protein